MEHSSRDDYPESLLQQGLFSHITASVHTASNQGMIPACVPQDARKGVLFDDFPPVLQLQLKRFEYDFQRDMMVKVSVCSILWPKVGCDTVEGRLSLSQAALALTILLLHALSCSLDSCYVHSSCYVLVRPDNSEES